MATRNHFFMDALVKSVEQQIKAGHNPNEDHLKIIKAAPTNSGQYKYDWQVKVVSLSTEYLKVNSNKKHGLKFDKHVHDVTPQESALEVRKQIEALDREMLTKRDATIQITLSKTLDQFIKVSSSLYSNKDFELARILAGDLLEASDKEIEATLNKASAQLHSAHKEQFKAMVIELMFRAKEAAKEVEDSYVVLKADYEFELEELLTSEAADEQLSEPSEILSGKDSNYEDSDQ